MTNQEQKLFELTQQANNIGNNVKTLKLWLSRTRKNLKQCEETCKSTNDIIGKLNGWDNK